MSEPNPYVEARREWNDRYLELVRERRWWQAVAGAEILLLLIFAVGFVWLSLQHKTVPYIVEVDSLGAALAIKPAETRRSPSSSRCSSIQRSCQDVGESRRRLSPTSWQLRWREEQRGLDGLLLGKSQWEGVVATEVVPPISEETIHVNPLGLYVTDLRWTKQL